MQVLLQLVLTLLNFTLKNLALSDKNILDTRKVFKKYKLSDRSKKQVVKFHASVSLILNKNLQNEVLLDY